VQDFPGSEHDLLVVERQGMAEAVINTQAVQGWAVQPTTEGSQTAIVFQARTGTAAFTLGPADLDRFAAKIIAEAATPVEARTPTPTPPATDSVPIPATVLSLEVDPADHSSVLLNLQLGKLRLAFAVDATTLLRSCKELLDQRRNLRETPPPGGRT
jgi:hypothetical protein